MKILAFHGSPGTPEDFIGLKKNLSEGTLIAPARSGFERLVQGDKMPAAGEELVVVGYSFGCAEALRFTATAASSRYSVKSLLMIAPYLFPKKDLKSRIKNTLISIPFFGQELLKKATQSAIDELLVQSSSPLKAPEEYQRAALKYRNPALLKRVVLEKSDPSFAILENLKVLKARNLSVGLVYGDQDLSSPLAQQIVPLRELLNIDFEEIFSPAGHALLWTHTTQLSELIRRKYL